MKRTIESWILTGILIVLVPAATDAVAGEPFETPVAIKHATIMTSSGEKIEDGTVVMEHGRITSVGTDIPIPADAEVFDATGMIVYPGFIDADTHLGVDAAEPKDDVLKRLGDEPFDAREGPQAQTVEAYRRLVHPHWRVEELFDPKAEVRESARKGGFSTALVSAKKAILSGRSAIIEMGDAPLRRSIIKSDFAQHAAFVTGRKPGSFFGQMRYPTTTMGAMAAFRQVLSDSQWQRALLAWSGRHPRAERTPLDRDLESLWEILDKRTFVAFLANTENAIHRALDMAEEFSLRPIIVGAREGWKVADRLKRQKVPVILSLKWSEEPKKGQSIKAEESVPTSRPAKAKPEKSELAERPWLDRTPLFDDDWQKQRFEPHKLYEERKRLWEEEIDNAKRLHEAGVRFAIGSFEMDSPADVLKRLGKAIERGLPEEVAVSALTRDAAAILGLGESIGEISAGRLANLTLMSKPLGEKKTEVKWVFVEGKAFDVSAGKKPSAKGKKGENGKTPDKGDMGEDEETHETVDSEATSQTASQPASQPTTSEAEDLAGWPEFACEIKADRKPRVQTGGNVLLKHATLLTITDGDQVDADLLIEGGRITAVGGDLTAPPGFKTFDLRGYCIMPGMIDPHSHICSEGGLNEFALSVTPEVHVSDVVDHTDVSAFRALAGGTTTVHTMHGSANTIGGQNVVLHLKYGRPAAEWRFVQAPQTVKFALGENVKQSNFPRGGNRFPGTRMGVEAVMRRSFDAALKYQADWEAYKKDRTAGGDPRPMRRDLRLEALADILDGRIWVNCHCYRADEILRLLDVAESYGFRIAVLQHILEGYRIIPEMRRHGCGASTFSDWWAYKLEAYNAIPQNAARMVQGGVVATINSDSPELVRHLNLEAAKSLRYGGLAPNDALRLCTLNGAIQLGIDKYVGSIEVGKFADLAIFDGHPLDTFSKCVMTLIGGEVYYQHESLDVASPPIPLAVKTFPPRRDPMNIPPSATGHYWIVGGTIHPISGPPIDDGLLEIVDGKIGRVGSHPEQSPPAGAIVVHAKGLHVYPGLINGGTPLGLIEIDSVAGSNDQRDLAKFEPDLMALSAYNPFSAEIDVARSEGVTDSMIPAGGGVAEGLAGLVRLSGWSMPEARVASSVGLCVRLPSLAVRFPWWMPEKMQKERKKDYRELMPKVEAFFRKAKHYALLSEQGQARGTESAQKAARRPRYDRKLEAMIPCMLGKSPIFFQANSYKQILEVLKFADRFDVRAVIYGGHEAWKLADTLAEKKIDVIIVRSMAYPSSEFEPWDSVYRNAAMLYKAGVRFCFATSEASLAKNLGIEAGMAVAHGLPEMQAIRAMTLNTAEILGVSDRLGSLESGKVADVILTTDTPLQACNSVVAAFISGQPVDLSNRHTRLDDKFLHRPAPKLPAASELRGPPAMRLRKAS